MGDFDHATDIPAAASRPARHGSEGVVLLHGFAGTRRTWDPVLARVAGQLQRLQALDLPGHGRAWAERPISFASCVEYVLARSPERFALCGYSLGGRVALQLALAAPDRVSWLGLVSASAGIEDRLARSRRREADQRLADELESAPIERFIERWSTQPLFAGDPPEVAALAREDQRRNRPHALAAALRGIGAGEMNPLWERLERLSMPVTVLAGERDRAYCEHARRMAALIPRSELLLAPGGHRLPLENPAALAAALRRAPGQPGDARR